MPRNANQSKQASYSLHFTPGSVTNVNLGDALSFFIGSFSASMWVKSPDNGKEFFSRYISANGVGNFRIGCGANTGTANAVSLMTTGGNALLSGSTDIIDGNWHHVCVTMDAISSTQYTRTIYVDGSQDAQDTVGLATYVSTSSSYGLNLGCNFPNNGHNNVDMSEVSIFDYALSPSQVTTLYGDSTNGLGNPMALPSPPIAYYPLGTSAWNGQYLAENNAIGDYVFDFTSSIINPSVTLTGLGISNEFSVSLWANVDTITAYRGPLGATSNTNWVDGFGIYINANKWNFFVDNWSASKVTSDTTITTNTWFHLVGTFSSSGTGKFYINGAKEGTDFTGVTLDGLTNNFAIGNVYNGGGFFDGKISNVQIWNKELIGSEVETLYNYGSPIKTLANIPQSSNLKAWYKLDASEVYNSTTTEWSIDNNQNPSAYPSSLNFTNDVVQSAFPAPASLNSSVFSYSIWVKVLTSAGFEEVLMGNFSGTGADIRFKGNENRIYFRTSYSNQTYQDEALVDDGGWHHIVATCDGTNLKIYVDKAKGTDGTGSYTSNTRVFKVGGGTQGNMQNVLISNACYFNTALSQSEIDTLYNNGTPLTDMSSFSSLVSWWKLNNMSAGIQDSKGSNNLSGSGPTEYAGFVNALAGDSSGMSQANLVQSDLQTVAPYSKYAMEFDASSGDYIDFNSIDLGTTNTISFWHKRGATSNQYVLGSTDGTQKYIVYFTPNYIYIRPDGSTQFLTTYLGNTPYPFPPYNNTTDWASYIITRSGDNIKLYLNSVEFALSGSGSGMAATTVNRIGTRGNSVSNTIDGSISNVSVWNTALTSSQVSELYNQGLPGNLNSHSAYSNLVSWWQLGENSSFDGNDWIVADEKGTNNGTSVSMPVGALVNGVGTTANGVSSGMSKGSLVGDAPYSTANAISTNMVVTSRVTGSGNTP